MLALLPLRVWLIIGACVALLAGAFAYRQHLINLGEQKAIEEVNRRNQEAKDAAISGANDVRACAAAGGVWSLRRGVCNRN